MESTELDLTTHVAATVINYQTPDLLDVAVRSFHRIYPTIQILIIDNGSQDTSPSMIRRLADELGSRVSTLFLDKNIFHGPAMHQALCTLQAPYVYVFDSDTETQRSGFIEAMWALLAASDRHYGAGKVVRANKRGFRSEDGTPVLAAAHMLLRKSVYHRLPSFIHHGLPTLLNFKGASSQGFSLCSFPIHEYVEHKGRGTAERYGYGLGLRSKAEYLLNKLGL